MTINLKNKDKIVKKFGKDAKDTGAAEVQVALLTEKIKQLTEQLKENHNDSASKRGLLMMVGKRKRLLAYLKNKHLGEYRELIKKLGIRG
jgi:small subunit ribosomal protein S15